MNDIKRSFVALDGLRGIAALAVAVLHASYFFGRLMPQAYLAVDFFFALSGFVLAHAYGERLRSEMSLYQFMIARLIRLYPLYFLSFLIWLPFGVWLVMARGASPGVIAIQSITAVLFLPAPIAGLYPFNSPAWSLFCELIANAWLAAFGARLSTSALVAFAALAAGGVIVVAARHGTLNGGFTWPTFYIGVIRVAYSFASGVIIYRLWQKHRPPVSLPAVVVGMILFLILAARPSIGERGAFAAFASLVAFPLLIWVGAASQPRHMMTKICTWLGAVSYAVYILDDPLLPWINKVFSEIPSYQPNYYYGVAYIAAVVVVADLATRLDKFTRRPKAAWLAALRLQYNGKTKLGSTHRPPYIIDEAGRADVGPDI